MNLVVAFFFDAEMSIKVDDSPLSCFRVTVPNGFASGGFHNVDFSTGLWCRHREGQIWSPDSAELLSSVIDRQMT